MVLLIVVLLSQHAHNCILVVLTNLFIMALTSHQHEAVIPATAGLFVLLFGMMKYRPI